MSRLPNEAALPVIARAFDPDVRHPELSPHFLSSPEQFSCGRVYLSSGSASTARRRRSLPPPPVPESDDDLGYDYGDLNETELLYDYNDSRLVNSTLNLRSARTRTVEGTGAPGSQPTFFPLWDYFAALPNLTAKENQGLRIVGGQEAFPGQLPWQVRGAEWGRVMPT